MVKFEELFQDTDEAFKADRKKRVGGYILGKALGEGSFAKVRLATHLATNEKVAIKVINKKLIAKREYVRKNMRREAVMLQRLDHPSIVGLIEVMETENSFYIVTDLAEGGDFMKYLTDRNCLDESETRKFMRDIVSSVDHMHRSGVLHRDLKIENLLLDGGNNMKIIDFGLSNYFDGENLLTTQCGSPAYAAPEIFSKQAYGPAVDIWSIGINMFAMLTGRLPFLVDPPNNLSKLHSLIMQGCKVPDYFSKSCQDLLSRLLDPLEKNRITMEELMGHPWLNLGNMPLHPRGLKMKMTNEDINPASLFYMVSYLNVPENQIRESVLNFKPNATTGTYLLLTQRLKKGSGLPDGVDFVMSDLSIDTSAERTHRGRPPSAHHNHQRGSQRENSQNRNNRDSSLNRRNDRENTFVEMNGHIAHKEMNGHLPQDRGQRTQLSVHVPYGDGIIPNGYDYEQPQDYHNSPYVPNGYIQREKAGRNIGSAGSNRELDTHVEHVYPLNDIIPDEKGKRTSLPDIPKEVGSSPRNRLKDIFKLSARLRKPKKKNSMKAQEKSQSMPEQLNQGGMRPPVQLHDALAIRNVRFQRTKDSNEDVSKRSDYYHPPRLAIIDPVSDSYGTNRDVFSPRYDDMRNRPHSREMSGKPLHPVHNNGEYIVPVTPPSSANEPKASYNSGRKYGYIKPPDMPKSKYEAQRERSNFAWSVSNALEGIGNRSATTSDLSGKRLNSLDPLSKVSKHSTKDGVNVSNVGYYTIPDNSPNFTRGRPQYRSDSSLSTQRNQSPFLRKDAKRMSVNTSEIYRGYATRRPDKGEGITGMGLVATPR